ncbi:MAG: hypothetical protein HN976_03120 [Lentisphaerae bacterium]|nr:hypothetical protein [Lentisphaerota bacterium]
MKHALLPLVPLLLISPFCLALDMAELEVDHNVNSSFVTPHTVWAKPYVLGQTRVLCFVNGRGTNAREVVELKQRFDLDPQMVFWGRVVDTKRDEWHGADAGIRRIADLLDQKWDAFVFLEVALENLPPEQQYSLIKAVTDGAGLVLIGANDKRVLKAKNMLEQPAFLSDVEDARAFSIRQGRGVRLPKRPTIAYRPGWEVAYDEWDMRVGKAILWAADRAPRLNLALAPKGSHLPREALPGTAATLSWKGALAAATAEVTLRRQDGTVIPLPQHSLGHPEGAVALEIPIVQAGAYVIDVIAREGKRVASFGSIALTVISQRNVENVALDPDWAEIGEPLSGEITLSGNPGTNERLVVGLLDRRDREIARQTVSVAADKATFTFTAQPWFPMLLEVRATLVDGTGDVSSAWAFAHVVKRHHGQFNFIMWDVPRGNLAPVAEESLARTGVTVHLGGGSPQPSVAAYDIAWIPYTTHIYSRRDDKGVMAPACWHDQTGIQAYVDKTVNKCVRARQHGVFTYSLGDEIAVRGSCQSPHCLQAYRAYLREQYGSIAALNASWNSAYTSFEDVQLSTPDDNDESEALRAGNFPRWFDRQTYKSYSFCKLCERFGEGFRRLDPKSRCGFEGAGTFKAADDLDGFVRSNAFWSPYPGTADEVLRSIAPRDFPRANWMGYTKDADTLLEKYWRMVTRGCDAVWWWRWEVLNRFHGWLSPNLDPYPAVQEILRDTQIMRDGLGDLLLNSEMQTDGIGILYSLPSAYAAKVQASPSYGTYESSHNAFHHAVRELGLNFRYFTDRQMELNEVDLGTFRVILLPLTQATSARQEDMLRQFVREGGVLIADVRPAIYDHHVNPLAAGQLDDVFGIKRTSLDDALIVEGHVTPSGAGNAQAPVVLGKVRTDGGVQASGAAAAGMAGQAPLFLNHPFGKGRAVLLNLAMSTYPTLGSEDTPEEAAKLWRLILEQGQVAPAFELRDARGQRLRNVEVTRWQNGPVQVVSVFRHKGQPEPGTMDLAQAMYAYDLKNGKELGQQRSISLTVTPYRALFYALSPRPLPPIAVQALPVVARGTVQRLGLTSTMDEGLQAVNIRVTRPDGTLADWVDSVALVGRKGTGVAVPVAFNDPSGTWAVGARDIITGRTTITQFEVK